MIIIDPRFCFSTWCHQSLWNGLPLQPLRCLCCQWCCSVGKYSYYLLLLTLFVENESKYQCSNQSQLGHFFQIYQIILFLWWDKTWLESFCSNLWKNFSNLMQIPKWYLKRDKPEEIQTFLFYSPSLETIKQ